MEELSEDPVEEYKKAFREMEVEEAKRGFAAHLVAYLIVNAFLIFINLWTSREALWFPFPLAGWGIGLAMHYVFSRPSHIVKEVMKKEALAEYYRTKAKKEEGKPA
ncbi:MAG: 2TM domain-containing protein [Candidatus Bathyarchaeia archaeon]